MDIDPATGNICPKDLRRKITARTKVITFVHWGGTPVDLDARTKFKVRLHEWFGFRPMVIEDCAHALGARWRGKSIGCLEHGNICTFSLQAIKHLTTGDGGLICLPPPPNSLRERRVYSVVVWNRPRQAQLQGQRLSTRERCDGVRFQNAHERYRGYDWYGQLPPFGTKLAQMRENAMFYQKSLSGIPGLTLLDIPDSALSSFWLFSFHIQNKLEFIDYMKNQGVIVSQVHARNDSIAKPFRTHPEP